MEQEYKICNAGISTEIVPGTENLKTLAQINEWLLENQVYYAENDPNRPADGGGSKFVVLPIEMS